MKVVLAGGSGLLGTALTASLLADSHEVVVLSRSPGGPDGARVALWDGKGLGEWAAEVDGADAVVNLSGYPVFSRWDKRTRGRILNSRVDTTRAVGEAIQAADQPPNVWVNLSAIGFYGDTGERRVDESDPAGRGFMAETCAAWEEACLSGNPSPGAQRSGGGQGGGQDSGFGLRASGFEGESGKPSTRRVLARMGVVLSRHGGALKPLLPLTRAFLGGHLGNGRQGMSWVHDEDAVSLLRFAMKHDVEGPLNVAAPNPVSNAEFMAALRKALNRPWSPPVPAFALHLAALAGVPPPEVLLEGQYVLPAAAQAAGYEFRFPELQGALHELLQPR